jgi:hypothetical protein
MAKGSVKGSSQWELNAKAQSREGAKVLGAV